MISLGHYYKIYNRFKTGKLLCWTINTAKTLGIRYLLVRMDTNLICNLRCKTCYFSGPHVSKNFLSPMKLEFFKTIASDVFPKTRMLFLSCSGEPLMTKGFEHYLEVAGRYNIPSVGYVTNGLLLTEEIIRSSVENKITEITISIDGARKDTYEYLRTKGNFDVLLSKLQLLKDVTSKYAGKKPSLRFNFTVTRTNHLEMPLLVELAKEYNISVIRFRIYTDWGGVLSPVDESLIGYEESFNSSLREAKNCAAKANIEIFAPLEFRRGNSDKLVKEYEKMIEIYSNPPCVHPWFSRYIDARGKIRICTSLPFSESSLSKHYSLKDFEKCDEERNRRKMLKEDPMKSCFANVCKGAYLSRANDDVNFLK